MKIKRSEFGVEKEDEEHNENENRNLLHEHRYIKKETIIVSKNIINEIVPFLYSSILDRNASICHSQT